MSTYAEKFSRCADCPRLLALQVERDDASRKREEHIIARDLDIVQSEYELELLRQLLDEEYVRVLDRVSDGFIDTTDKDYVVTREIYAKVVAAIEEKDKFKKEMDEVLDRNDMATEMADKHAELVVGSCVTGPRYRRKITFCSSVMRNTVTVIED